MNKFLFIFMSLLAIQFYQTMSENKYNHSPLHKLALGKRFSASDCTADGMSKSDIKRIITEQDIDIDQQDVFGATALHYAAMNDDGLFALLIECGASTSIVDNTGWNVLHYVMACGSCYNLYILLNKHWEINDLVNQQDRDGNTPLHVAAGGSDFSEKLIPVIYSKNDSEGARVLVEHGADCTIRNKLGNTPVECAKNYGRKLFDENTSWKKK